VYELGTTSEPPWPGLSKLVPAIYAFLPVDRVCSDDVGGRDNKPGQGEEKFYGRLRCILPSAAKLSPDSPAFRGPRAAPRFAYPSLSPRAGLCAEGHCCSEMTNPAHKLCGRWGRYHTRLAGGWMP
jgi:hypothetical protein